MKSILLAALLSFPLVHGCSTSTSETPDQALDPEALQALDLRGVERLHRLDGLYLASQPSAVGFEELRAAGVRTVLNLRPDSELSGVGERAQIEGLGLTYLHLPWKAPELDDRIFGEAREHLARAERPLLVHCSSGNRVGALWIPFRVLDEGVPLEQALSEARAIGLSNAGLEAQAKDYVARRAGGR